MSDKKKKSAPAEVPAAEVPPGPSRSSGGSARGPRNIVHRLRGGALFLLGVVSTFLLMANHEQTPRGALIGMITTAIAVLGLLDMMGLLAVSAMPPPERARSIDWRLTALWHVEGEPLACSPVVTVPLAILIFGVVFAVAGMNGLPIAILLALAVLGISAIRRPAMMVLVVCSAIILPFLGVYGLWDPWETHYGEVAREILARDDWISLWWAQEDWFWSKPIFIFWIEALSMSALGVDFRPDANPAFPEWALRLPHYFLAIGALLALYAMVQRAFGKRAGVLAAIVLCTMPHWFFLSHQAITDMPFVSTMTMAMAMLGLAIQEPSDREVTRYRFGPLVVSAQHAVIGAIAMASIPQITLLISRNVTWVTGGFAWHRDRFMFGSAGNGGNPGNAEIREVAPAFDGIETQPVMLGILCAVGLIAILGFLRRERRAQALYMFAFYFFCALSFMAKGIAGFAMPGMIAMFWLIASRRWDLLLEGKLRVAAGILVVMVVGMPWYVAMYLRHGQGFTDRLLVHDHINRLTAGVHGDTGSVEYFFEQLGYGLFPWIALAPIAIAAWVVLGSRRRPVPIAAAPVAGAADAAAVSGEDAVSDAVSVVESAQDRAAESRREILTMIGLWGTSAFVLFSAMTTKFHHYIFPAVPACGALIGIALDRLLGHRTGEGGREDLERPSWRGVVGTIVSVLAPVPVVIGVAGLWGDVRGVAPETVEASALRDWVLRHPWFPEHTLPILVAGGLMFALGWWLLEPARRENDRTDEAGASRWMAAAAGAGLFAAPAIVSLVGRDLAWVTSARPYGYERLIHLFVYNYGRPWPEYLDYRPIMTGFAIVAAVVIGAAALPVLRQLALRAFLGVAIMFAVWCLDFYMIDLSPHWGQRELLAAYYEQRGGPDEEIIAWQMNWKGENFYTGNAVLAFVDLDNRRLQEWAREHPGEQVWFLLEHQRLSSLQSTLSGAEVTAVTDDRLDNKFILVRARLAGTPAARPIRAPAQD